MPLPEISSAGNFDDIIIIRNFFKLVWLIPVLFSFQAHAQQPAVIKIYSDTMHVAEGAILILQAIDKKAEKQQQIYFSDANGEATNQFPSPAILFIQYFGYETISDTIQPGNSYTYHLKKLAVDLNEIVVTGQYDINTSDKSVYNVKVIDQQTIHSMAAQNLTELLSNQLTSRLSQDNILGSSVSLEGISGQNVKILIDGVNVIGRENGNVDLSQINLNNVERVEIIEGPMSVSYGTDAIGGLINIVTRKSSSYPWEADLNLYYETAGSYNGDGAILWRKNNSVISLSGGRYFFEGFSLSDSSRFMDWKPRQQYFGTASYGYSNKFFNLNIKSDYFNQEIQNKGNPVLTPYQAYAFDDYYFTRRINESFFLEYRFKNNSRLQFTNAYSNYRHIKNTFRKDLVSLNQEMLEGAGIQDTAQFSSISLRGTYSKSLFTSKLNYQGGYDINLESGKGEKIDSGAQRIGDYALFGSFEYQPLKHIFIRPGLRISYNTRYGSPLTPSINVKLDVSEIYSIRASYARGFRAPSLKELDLYFVDVNHYILGNDSLGAENSNNFNFSFSGNNSIGENKLKTEVSLFYNNINNIITLAMVEPTTQLYTYININKYITTGGTFSASFKAKHLSFTTGFSLLGLYNTLSDSFDIEKFSWTPEFQNNLTYTFQKAGIDAAVYFKNTGTTPGFNLDADGNVFQTFIDPYTIADISVTKYLWKKHIGFAIGVKNLFNVVDIQSNSLQATVHSSGSDALPYSYGRFVFASLRLKLYKDQ